MTATPDDVARILRYHERTKHHVHRYARSLGYLDWDTQPDPFRTYAGALRTDLPLAADGVTALYDELYRPGALPPRAPDASSLGALFELALGLTAWKEYGESRWALRADPSSGNLHPTEGYLVTAGAPGVPAGVHHYVSRDHCLEQRCALTADAARALARLLPPGSFLVGLGSIHWRESWKYGERAFRYCQHDAGHVLGTLRFAAGALGLAARLLESPGDADVARVLGLDRDDDFARVADEDREHPDALLLVAPPEHVEAGAAALERDLDALCGLVAAGAWTGEPNELSAEHHPWGEVEAAAAATWKPRTAPASPPSPGLPAERGDALARPATGARAATIVRGRRSAVALDGVSSLARDRFYALLERLVPSAGSVPFDVLPWAPRVHLGLFVHRVDDLAPGVYLLERTGDVHERFVALLGDKPLWRRPEGCPESLRLYCIGEVDCRRAASSISCGQDIAGDGAFSLGMLAEFRAPLEAGAHWYRRLFWESGLIGQVLYLEAEAAGVRGTGIGCYFDDAAHRAFGLTGDAFQSLYHFTVGGPVEDTRLVTHPPYAHLTTR